MRYIKTIILLFYSCLLFGAGFGPPLNNQEDSVRHLPKYEVRLSFSPSSESFSDQWDPYFYRPRHFNYLLDFRYIFSENFSITTGLWLTNKHYELPNYYPHYAIVPLLFNYHYLLGKRWEFLCSAGVLAGTYTYSRFQHLPGTPSLVVFVPNKTYTGFNVGYGLRYSLTKRHGIGFKTSFSYQFNDGVFLFGRQPYKYNSSAFDLYFGYKFGRLKPRNVESPLITHTRDTSVLRRNAVYIEAGGSAGFYSLNYEYAFLIKERSRYNIRAGAGMLDPGFRYLPVGFSGIYGKPPHHFEIGTVVTPVIVSNRYDFSVNREIPTYMMWFLSPNMGYRFQKDTGRMLFRILYTPLFYKEYKDYVVQHLHWAGISVGYTF